MEHRGAFIDRGWMVPFLLPPPPHFGVAESRRRRTEEREGGEGLAAFQEFEEGSRGEDWRNSPV